MNYGENNKKDKKSRIFGIILSLIFHILLLYSLTFNGLKYIYPPPEEKSVLIEFDQEIERVTRVENGTVPKAEKVANEINLVKSSKSNTEGKKSSVSSQADPGDKGDVETVKKIEIDKRALFQSPKNNDPVDSLNMFVASEMKQESEDGSRDGNSQSSNKSGQASAKLKGRSVVGVLPRPSYPVQASGTVVVEIWVDQWGSVQKAMPGAEGTTVMDKSLWNVARNAALEAHFNMASDAPVLQKGTISYIFMLK